MNIKTTASLLFGILFLIWFAFLTWEHVKETEKENDDSSEDALSFRDRSVTVFPTSTLKGEDDEPDMIVNASFQENRWRIGEPHPVEPENSSLPPFGKSTLRAIFGWKEEWHIRNSICGFVQNPKEIVSYEKKAGKTKVTFDSGWAIEINDATGQILVPPGLPPLSDNELADMTWRAFPRMTAWSAGVMCIVKSPMMAPFSVNCPTSYWMKSGAWETRHSLHGDLSKLRLQTKMVLFVPSFGWM